MNIDITYNENSVPTSILIIFLNNLYKLTQTLFPHITNNTIL